MIKERKYAGDVRPIRFVVAYDPEGNPEEPWLVDTDEGTGDTHNTLDEVLYWELVMGGRIISEEMRAKINTEWKEG